MSGGGGGGGGNQGGGKKKRSKGVEHELNLQPLMNVILIMLPILLTASENFKLGVINVATPQIGPSSEAATPDIKPDEQPLKLTIALTDRGITVFVKDQVIENKNDPLGPTLPKIDGEEVVDGQKKPSKVYDVQKLVEMLSDLKNSHPTETNIIISAEPHIRYMYIVQIMDAARETKEGDKKKLLFPDVVLSAGVA